MTLSPKIIENAKIGPGTKIWHFVNIYDSTIGDNCTIGSYTEIGGAVIGNNVRIEANVFICRGTTVEDDVFIGPGTRTLNDKYPPSGGKKWQPVIIKRGARIGGGVIILPNVTIGEHALIGAGSVVTKNVEAYKIVKGNPAK